MPDKLLIVGLGNPGKRYQHTRHNIGFMVADELAARGREAFRTGRGEYLLCRLKMAGCDVILQKPLTYMNLSGGAVQQAMHFFKLTPESLLVVADDINLPFGKMRIRGQGSDGGHNGLGSIIATLGTQAFARLRIGVGSDFTKGEQADFVLSSFAATEQKEVGAIVQRAADAVLHYVEHGLAAAMNHYND